MTYKERTDLISSLAAHMGVSQRVDTKCGVARYDANTGTLYCEGMTITKPSIDSIRDWYETQMNIYKNMVYKDHELLDTYIKYAVAYNAICMLYNNLTDGEDDEYEKREIRY